MIERGGGTHERYWRVGMACELRHPVSALQALGEISHQRAIASFQHVDERHSEAAYLAAARLEAHRFLKKGGSGRYLAGRMCLLYVNAGYPSELNDWAGFDDYYDMLRDGVIGGNVLDLDADVRAAARKHQILVYLTVTLRYTNY
jgi:hypothetical protein